MADKNASIVVLGAGVVGLTTALLLTRAGFRNITVVAKHMPADNNVEYTSKWAGANWVPVSKEGSVEASWDIATWHELLNLARTKPGAGVWLTGKKSFYRDEDLKAKDLKLWFKDLVFDYRILGGSEVPDWADWGTFYRTISLDPTIYLHWLQSNCLESGVQFRRATFSHIREAFLATAGRPDLVINCSGIQASTLGGVDDDRLRPILGQLVIVANEIDSMYSLSGDSGMDDSIGECFYLITRPAGGGTAIGGCEYVSTATEPDMDLAERLMKRAIKVAPNLVPPGAGIEALRVVRHQVGWRPHREGGPRIEREVIEDDELGVLNVVHCYGTGGFGYQSSYGVAGLAVDLATQSLTK